MWGCYSMIALPTIGISFCSWLSQDDIELLKLSLLYRQTLFVDVKSNAHNVFIVDILRDKIQC